MKHCRQLSQVISDPPWPWRARVGTGGRCTDAHWLSSQSSVTPAHGDGTRSPIFVFHWPQQTKTSPYPRWWQQGIWFHPVPGWCASWCSLRVTLMWMPVGTVSSTVFCVLRLLNILNTTPYCRCVYMYTTYYVRRSHLNTAILCITLLFICFFI